MTQDRRFGAKFHPIGDRPLMTDYPPKQTYINLKSALTRATNNGDAPKILKTIQTARRQFGKYSYPDDWTRWTRALSDLISDHELRRRNNSPMDDAKFREELYAERNLWD